VCTRKSSIVEEGSSDDGSGVVIRMKWSRSWRLLGEAGSGAGNVTPLLDDGLLDLAGVLPGSGADLLGDVDALLLGVEQGNELGDVLALSLGLEVASLLGNFLDDGFLLVEALLGSGGQDAARGTAKLAGNLLTFSLGSVLLDFLAVSLADLLGPFGTLLLGGVTLGDILALLFLDGLTLNNIIFNVMFVVFGLTLRFVDSTALFGSFSFANEGSVAEFDGLFEGNLLVFDEARFLEVLLAFLFLLRLEVGGVSGVATLGVGVMALNLLVVFSLLNHDNLVDTTLASGGDSADAQVEVTVSLTGVTGRLEVDGLEVASAVVGVSGVVMVMVVAGGVSGVEGEGVHERTAIAVVGADASGVLASGRGADKSENAKLSK